MVTVPLSGSPCGNRPGVVCARKDGGYTCGGDSGGPAVADQDGDGTWVQYGLVSFGNGGCAVKDHTAFTDVSTFVNTIMIVIGNTSNAPVDCQWSAWSWGSCSKSCSGGTQMGSRTISQQALNGGKECTGDSTITQDCNTHSCSSGEPYTQEICSALIYILFFYNIVCLIFVFKTYVSDGCMNRFQQFLVITSVASRVPGPACLTDGLR